MAAVGHKMIDTDDLLYHWVAAIFDFQLRSVCDLRFYIVARYGNLRQRIQGIDLGHISGPFLDSGDLRDDFFPDILEKLIFQLRQPLL